MEHPRMYDDADPLLVRLRPLALAFPESAEVEAWGRPTFRAGRKIFAVYGVTEQHPHALVVKPDPDERPALVADPRFFSPPYFGPGGWLALDLTAGTDWTEVRELLDASYRQVALVRMRRALDDADAHRHADGTPTSGTAGRPISTTHPAPLPEEPR